MNWTPSHVRALVATAAAGALLSACSGGAASSALPSGGMAPAALSQSAPSQALTAMHEHGGDNDGGGSGGGGTSTFTLTAFVTGLRADSSLNFGLASKGCNATVSSAPSYTAASFTSLALSAPIVLNDCNRANSGLTQPTTNDYLVLVDETQANAVTAIAGPASETTGVWTFNPIVSTVTLNKTDTYAFFVATGTLTTSCSGDDNDHHHDADVRAMDEDGHHHHGDCGKHHHHHHGDGDGEGGDDN